VERLVSTFPEQLSDGTTQLHVIGVVPDQADRHLYGPCVGTVTGDTVLTYAFYITIPGVNMICKVIDRFISALYATVSHKSAFIS